MAAAKVARVKKQLSASISGECQVFFVIFESEDVLFVHSCRFVTKRKTIAHAFFRLPRIIGDWWVCENAMTNLIKALFSYKS